jgi:hypothetical protein
LRTHLLLLTLTPACSCDYFCKFQFRPIHPPSRRLSKVDDVEVAAAERDLGYQSPEGDLKDVFAGGSYSSGDS